MKKFVAVVLAIAMCLVCLTACGSKGAADSSTLIIGGIGPMTGDYANYGTSVRNGAQLAAKEINAAGGVNGMTFDVRYEDSVADPDSAVNAYGKLMDNGMALSLGGVLSGETASIVAAAKDDGIVILTPSASADAVLEGSDTAFRVCFADSSQGLAAADFIDANNLTTKVAVFYQSDLDYSVGLYKAFTAECEACGIEIVEVQTFTTDTSTDFSTQINAIRDSGVDMIFIPIYAAEASVLLTQASGKLDGKYFFGCDGLDGILTKMSDPKQAENVMILTPFAADSTDANVQAFVAAYEKDYGATPDQFAADGYDGVYAFKAAVEKAGITAADDPDLNAKILAAMLEITVEGVTGTMSWQASGECSKPAKVMIIRDGVAVPFN